MMQSTTTSSIISEELLCSSSLFTNNYSQHLHSITSQHYNNIRHLFSFTDDDATYENYTATTVDTGWTFFIIAAVISVVSFVILPVNVKLGRYCCNRDNSRNGSARTMGRQRDRQEVVTEQAIVTSSKSNNKNSLTTLWMKIQDVHSKVFLWILDRLLYRWGKRRRYNRHQRNARAREREGRASLMLRIETTAAASCEEGTELSLRSPPRSNNHDNNNRCQLMMVLSNSERDAIRSPFYPKFSFQKTWKLLMTILRYDNETHRLLRLAIPFCITGLIMTGAELVLLGFISQYLGTDSMVAFAIVDLTVGTTSEFFGGFVEAVSSLGSMAYGAKNYFAVGQYVQLSVICYVLCQLPFFIVWGRFIKEIILLFGFDETAAEIASRYVWVALPLDILRGISETLYDFLEVIEYEAYANAFACVATVCNVVLCWLGMYLYDADLVFVGLISLGTEAFFLILNILICLGFGWWSKYEDGMIRSLALKNRPLLKEFLKTSAPLAIGCLLAYAEWEVLTVFAAVLGPAEAATWAVLGFIWDCFESTTEAFGDAGEVRVSYQLGKGRPQLAKLSSYKAMFMGLTMSLVMSATFLSLTNVLPTFLTTDKTIQEMLKTLFPLVALGNITMSAGMVCWALVGAQLRYLLATTIATFCSFCITLPLGAIFTIVLNYDLKGLAFSVIIGYITTALLLSTVLLMSDWEKLSEIIRAKVLSEEEEDSSDDDDDSDSSSSSSSSSS